jgi:hypothetical protein
VEILWRIKWDREIINKGENTYLNMKQIFVNELPCYDVTSRYAGKINWSKSIGYNVKFKYNKIEDYITIIDYKYPNLTIKYNNETKIIPTYSFLKCSIGALIGEYKKEYYYNIGDVITTNSGKIKILEQIQIKINNGNWTKKGYKYKCLIDNYEGIINEYNLKKGQGCAGCGNKIVRFGIDDIYTLYPELIKYFINIEDTYKYSRCSEVSLNFKCPDCGYIKKIVIKTFIKNNGFICPECGDGKSYPEKFVFEILRQLKVEFDVEYNPVWIKPRRYDFYINNLKMIIETHGEQHYNNSFKLLNSRDTKKEKINDNFKEEKAKNNGIQEYIIIDCRKSNLEWIKNNILNSRLKNYFNLSNIDWNKCHEIACNSRVKEISNIWNSGINSTINISKLTNIHNSTVRRYLKQGRKIGWNNYDENVARKSGGIKQKIKVICLNTLEIFDSSKEVEDKYKIHKTDICRMCNGKGSFISVNNKPYVFMYLKDYEKESSNNINNKIKFAEIMYGKSSIPKQIICLNTLKQYSSIKEAAKENNLFNSNISNVCRKVDKFAGKLENGVKMVWMYYNEYITKTKDEILEIINNAQDKQIICITTNMIFNSIAEAGDYYNIKNFKSTVYRVLKNKRGHCGKLKDGTKLKWAYYYDYILNNKNNYENKTRSKKVKCIETGKIFSSIANLVKESKDIFGFKLNQTGISRVCRKERKHYKNLHFEYL